MNAVPALAHQLSEVPLITTLDPTQTDDFNLLPPERRIEFVDFKHLLDPLRPKPEPLLQFRNHNLALRGEFIRVGGEAEVGKSWFLLEMSCAASIGGTFAGIHTNAKRVMWIDEEGSEDILAERLAKLGITPEWLHDHVTYALQQSVFLDDWHVREELFEKVQEARPEIIVIDSATRISNMDENNAGEMARLYNLAFKPLCRQYGATVFLIDHLRKPAPNQKDSSDDNIRGSSEKRAQVDRQWTLEKVSSDSFKLRHTKSRRSVRPPSFVIKRAERDGLLRHEMNGAVL